MKTLKFVGFLLALGMGLTALQAVRGQTLRSAFNYQGQIKFNGVPVDGTCDFEFTLWDAPTMGAQVGTPMATVSGVQVANGVFTQELDFGSDPFDGNATWLEPGLSGDNGVVFVLPTVGQNTRLRSQAETRWRFLRRKYAA